jgi:hypothetical protein
MIPVKTRTKMSRPLCVPLLLIVAFACTGRSHPVDSRDAVHGTRPSIAKAADTRDTPSALQRLAAADSSVVWEPQSVLVGDVDCDGVPDSVFVGRSPSRVAVGVIRANSLVPDILSFGVHGGVVQDEVGSSNAQLTFESLDYDPREEVGEIDGFQRSRVCKGLDLGDGESDSMHLFWNRKSHQLEWWRL